jgi:NADP-dependent 3-hydroxy acid dehydrogenase YdfG
LAISPEQALLNPTSILITGAAGGIGTALAKAYAAPGIHLFLGDIEADRLESLASQCRSLGAQTWSTAVDVTNREAMATWITQSHQVRPLDLVIALAGISCGTFSREETPEETRAVFDVNLDGMLNTVEPAISLFRQRGRGQIAVTSSLAGIRGFPVAPSYCATKAAIRVYGEGLRSRLHRENISVAVINPAFVKSPMTDANPYPMPFLVSADRAARIIKNKLAKGKARICFPWPFAVGGFLFSLVPPSWIDRFIKLK